MSFTLRNQRNPNLTLTLTHESWFGILDLADLYGWSPLGTILPGGWQDIEIPLTGYDLLLEEPVFEREGVGRLVILEDALNLADTLEQVFFEYEPMRVPPIYYLFEPDDPYLRSRPSIGAITAVIDLCRQGAFWVEPYQR